MKFIDRDDDRLYEIDSVCREDLPGRRASFANLFFRYHDVDTPDVFEYTPCMEVLNSSWCQWQQTPSAAAREQRAARRDAPGEKQRENNSNRRMRSENNSPQGRITRSRR